MEESKKRILIEKRLELLKQFHDALDRWFHGGSESEGRDEARSFINRNLIAVRNAVREAGTLKLMSISPPPAIGGIVRNNINPFDNLFESFYGMSLIPAAMDSIEQAIGVTSTCKMMKGSLR